MKKQILIVVLIFTLIFFVMVFIAAKNNRSMLTSLSVGDVKTVIIDAGHGGFDGGAVAADGTVEKDINLSIAQKLNMVMSFLGYDTIMTRNDDISVHDEGASTVRQKKVSDIHNRMKITQDNPDSVFVSIHQNFYSDPAQKGTQVFYSKNNVGSLSLAQSIQDSVVEKIQPENKRAVKASGTEIYLLYYASVPSVLVECGFISNPSETRLLKDESYQKNMSMAIASGICSYLTNSEA